MNSCATLETIKFSRNASNYHPSQNGRELSVAGGEGFEPSTPNLGGMLHGSNLDYLANNYKVFLGNKYTSKQYATAQFNNAMKYSECLDNPSKILSLPQSQRPNVLKAIVCLSKYLGCYEQYKMKLKNYGIKWTNEDTAFNGFLAIFNHKHDSLPKYIKEIQSVLCDNERLFVRFLAITGLRKNEGLNSFNMIIDLHSKGKLGEYYNEELEVLEHFKYGKVFLRGTKNAYISFVSKEIINQVCNSQPVTYNAIHCRFMRKKLQIRLKELRSYNNTYLRKNGVL